MHSSNRCRPIVERLLEGDRRAFETFFARYFQPIYARCLAVAGSEGPAQALCDQILESLVRGLPCWLSSSNRPLDEWVRAETERALSNVDQPAQIALAQ